MVYIIHLLNKQNINMERRDLFSHSNLLLLESHPVRHRASHATMKMNLHNPTAEENGYTTGDTSQLCASGLDIKKRQQNNQLVSETGNNNSLESPQCFPQDYIDESGRLIRLSREAYSTRIYLFLTLNASISCILRTTQWEDHALCLWSL